MTCPAVTGGGADRNTIGTETGKLGALIGEAIRPWPRVSGRLHARQRNRANGASREGPPMIPVAVSATAGSRSPDPGLQCPLTRLDLGRTRCYPHFASFWQSRAKVVRKMAPCQFAPPSLREPLSRFGRTKPNSPTKSIAAAASVSPAPKLTRDLSRFGRTKPNSPVTSKSAASVSPPPTVWQNEAKFMSKIMSCVGVPPAWPLTLTRDPARLAERSQIQ
jgi:hypothetical protein